MEYPAGATPLDPDEMEGLKFRHVTTRGELDGLEQANIQAGLLWLSRRRRGDVLTEDFARTLHKRLFGDVWRWAGTFRTTVKSIGVDPIAIAADLYALMGDARHWVDHGTYGPVEAAVRLHHRMVSIHPFPNGNGRHARIMADTVLMRVFGVQPIDWTAGHDLQRMNDRRTAYIAALRAADRGDLGPLLTFAAPTEGRHDS